MTTRLIQRMALRLLSAGVFAFCGLTAAPAPAAELDPGKARLEAIKVELALLGDASAYTQPLTVRAEGDGVAVRGTVPSEAVHRRVLEIARRSCYLPIHDRVAVAGVVSRASAPLVKSAHDRLVRELGAQADAIKILPESGKLRLTGRVRSVEDKLHASRTLRGLPGCAGLINNLEVKPDAPPSFTLLTHADEEAPVAPLPTEPPSSEVVPAQADAPDQEEAPPPPPRPAPPPVVRKRPAPVVQSKPAPITQPAPVARPAPTPAVAQTPTPSLTEWPPAHRTGPVTTPLPAGATFASHPLAYRLNPQPAPAADPAVLTPAPAITPAAAITPVAAKPDVKKAAPAVGPVAAKPVVAKPVVKQTAPSKPLPAAREVIRKVRIAGGAYLRDVHVETGADGFLAVHVYATADGEQVLATRLFDVPELTLSNVRLHVHLAK